VAASASAANADQPLVPWNGLAAGRAGLGPALALLSAPDVLEALDAAVIVRSPAGEIEYWNRGAERLYGWTAEEAIGHAGIGFLVAAGEEPRFAELVEQVNRDGSAEAELRLRRKDGSTFVGYFRTAGVRDAGGRVIAIVGVTLDISQRVEAVEALVRGETRLHEAERLAGVGSWEYDIASNTLIGSPGITRIFGLLPGSALDLEGFLALAHPDDRERVRRVLAQAVRDCAACDLGYRIVRADGSVRWLQMSGEVVRDTSGSALRFRGATVDVTAQREAERARSESESMFRKGFDEAPIGMAIQRPSDGRYLRVNDALCQMLGRAREELLELTFYEITHPADVPVSREARAKLADGGPLRDLQKRYTRPDGSSVWASVHVSAVEDASGAVTALFSQVVDISEQKAREAELESVVAEAGWLARIRDALDEDRLVLFAQPIVDLSSGETVQRELLIRMRERDGTIISPGEFLPAAERYGLIGEIDTWVIGQAASLAADGTAVEINLSGLSIGDPAILAAIERALEESGADPKLLVFEVTETAVASDLDAGRAFAEQLTALGCGFALDDFGTGFGGLSYLKHLPANTLKIDIEFVRDLLTSKPDQRLVRAIVDLARGFGQTTVAEGVEDEQTLQRLREMGVDRAQGYFLGRPGPLQDEPESWSPRTGDARRGASPGDPIEQVRSFLDVFASRDLDLALPFLHPEVEVRVFGTAEHTGQREPYRGHDGVRAYFGHAAAVWEKLEIEPTTFRRADDTVILFGKVHARSAGVGVSQDSLWIWKFRDGLIASVQTFRTPNASSGQPR
jgi:PAS domain S-box-containing protein